MPICEAKVMDMIQKVKQYIQSWNMIEKGEGVVVGVSGGADSVALLLVLKELQEEMGLSLYGVHINHGIRKEASEDAEFTKQLCDRLAIPFFLFEENIPAMAKEQGMTEEEMGRVYRYRCFENIMEQVGASKLAVAHHMDDQAETLLFHLVRGSRLTGMEGMRPITKGNIIRPLLTCRKQELTDWLLEKRIEWKEDRTNKDNHYARNSIRNQVIPILEQVNAQAVTHIAEYAEEMTAYREYFQRAVDGYLQEQVCCESGVKCECNRKHLLKQEQIVAKSVIYEMLSIVCGHRKDIGNVHVQSVYDLLDNQSGRRLSLPYDMVAEISYETLIIRKSLQEVEESFVLELSVVDVCDGGVTEFSLPTGKITVSVYSKKASNQQQWDEWIKEARNTKNNYTKYFECDTIKDTLCVRYARSEDYFIMNEMGGRKKVTRYFIDEKIPVEQRKRVMVLAENDNVLWILGRRRCEGYKVDAQSTIIMKVTYKGE